MSTILVGTDTSAAADLAVEDAARLARGRGAELLVLYVRPGLGSPRGRGPDRAADPGGYLALMRERFPGVATRTRIETGEPADRSAMSPPGARRHDRDRQPRAYRVGRWRVETASHLVLRHAPCSVFIVDTRRAQ